MTETPPGGTAPEAAPPDPSPDPGPSAAAGIALKLASVLLFTLMAACIKAARDEAPTGQAVFFRSFFAIPPILIWAMVRGDLSRAFRVKDPFAHLNRGLVGVVAMACGFAALGLLPLPETIAINYAAPLLATALAAWLLGEQVRLFRWSAVVVGLFGVLVMLWPRLTVLASGAFSDAEALGAWFALLGALFVALATIHIRRLTQTETTLSIVFWFSVSCTVASLATIPFGWAWPTGPTLVLLIASGVLGGVAQILMTEGYRLAPASTLAPFEYSSMIYGLALGWLLFSEAPSVQVLIGAAIVIGAGLFIIWRERQLRIDRTQPRKAGSMQA
ncbi:DMT family transporter [Rubrimonas sp.]|uniref:DMT family transporter n=1 Tax=Rubrimonas sp. TaxID=2036015 RepID=UPI002FDC9F14